MTTWLVTYSWRIEADTPEDALRVARNRPGADVGAHVVGQPTGWAARRIHERLLDHEADWRERIGDAQFDRTIEYWWERSTMDGTIMVPDHDDNARPGA